MKKTMKKLPILAILCMLALIFSCNKVSTKSIEDDEEFREMAEPFNIIDNIDTVNLIPINAKVFQVLDENTCLANELSNEKYKWYNGDIIMIMSEELLFDNKVFEGDFILLGTYHYQSVDSMPRTVKLYSDYEFFRQSRTAIYKIREINNK